jgi:hypothetical protein
LGGSNGGSLKGILRGNPPGLDQSPETSKQEHLIRLDLGNTQKHNICLERPPGGTRTATRRPKMPQGSQESPRRAHDPRTSSKRHQDVPDPRSLKVLNPRLPKPILKSTRGHPRGIGGIRKYPGGYAGEPGGYREVCGGVWNRLFASRAFKKTPSRLPKLPRPPKSSKGVIQAIAGRFGMDSGSIRGGFKGVSGWIRCRFGLDSGSNMDRCGVHSGSDRGRFELDSGSIRDRFGLDSGWIRSRFGSESRTFRCGFGIDSGWMLCRCGVDSCSILGRFWVMEIGSDSIRNRFGID